VIEATATARNGVPSKRGISRCVLPAAAIKPACAAVIAMPNGNVAIGPNCGK